MDLPLPPSRFVVAPTRITRDQRKAEKKTKSEGPKIQESKEGSTQKMIHKLHLKEQEEKEILSTSVLYLCSGWVDEGPARKKM